jgi:DNA invertase Pin-like site-specific DNA recombinase
MVFTMVGAVAEMQRSLIPERVLAGVDRAKRQGKKLGQPRVLVDDENVSNSGAMFSGRIKVLRRLAVAAIVELALDHL